MILSCNTKDKEETILQGEAHIAFHVVGHNGWIAGRVHIDCFVHALKAVYQDSVRVYLLSKKITPEVQAYARETGCDELIQFNASKPKSNQGGGILGWFKKRSTVKNWDNDLRDYKLHAVFGRNLTVAGGLIPTLSWFPDFQHKHCPDMFSAEEYAARDAQFLRSAKASTRIVLMSQSALADFKKFLPEYAHKGRLLKTTSRIPGAVFLGDAEAVIQKYGLPSKFIYVPNQFWKHKNHITIIEALKILKNNGDEVHIVCSGHKEDYRHPEYFTSLMQQITSMGLFDQVHVLGLIPKDDVFQLMRQSVGIVNASLFEGYGLAADEARNMGVRSLLSDISAHREHASELTNYFDPRNAKELADKMKILYSSQPGPDESLEEAARLAYPERLSLCAKSFLSLVEESTCT